MWGYNVSCQDGSPHNKSRRWKRKATDPAAMAYVPKHNSETLLQLDKEQYELSVHIDTKGTFLCYE